LKARDTASPVVASARARNIKMASPSHATTSPTHATSGHEQETDRAVHDFLAILEEHKRNCERAGKYIEAEIAKKRLEELRQHEEQRREESLRSRQVAQRLGIEEAHMLEFQQFNAMWDQTMKVCAAAANALSRASLLRCSAAC